MPPIGLRSSARSARPPCWPRPRAPRVRAASRGSPPAARARRRCRRRSRRCGECRALAGRWFAERPAAAGRRRRARRRRRFTAPLHDDRLRGDAHDHGPRRGMGGLAVDCPPPTAGAPGTVMTMYTGWMPPELGALDAGGVDAGGGEGGLDGGRVVVPGATWVGLVDRAAEVWTGRGRRPACRQGRRRGRWSAPPVPVPGAAAGGHRRRGAIVRDGRRAAALRARRDGEPRRPVAYAVGPASVGDPLQPRRRARRLRGAAHRKGEPARRLDARLGRGRGHGAEPPHSLDRRQSDCRRRPAVGHDDHRLERERASAGGHRVAARAVHRTGRHSDRQRRSTRRAVAAGGRASRAAAGRDARGARRAAGRGVRRGGGGGGTAARRRLHGVDPLRPRQHGDARRGLGRAHRSGSDRHPAPVGWVERLLRSPAHRPARALRPE
jgi:hypothetical protein